MDSWRHEVAGTRWRSEGRARGGSGIRGLIRSRIGWRLPSPQPVAGQSFVLRLYWINIRHLCFCDRVTHHSDKGSPLHVSFRSPN